MGIENVLEGHGIGIAITGMSVVFAGLVLVYLYLLALPRAFEWSARASQARAARRQPRAVAQPPMPRAVAGPGVGTGAGMEPELLAAIAYVLQAERERELASDYQRITLRDDDEQRVWTAIGKMRTLGTRL